LNPEAKRGGEGTTEEMLHALVVRLSAISAKGDKF